MVRLVGDRLVAAIPILLAVSAGVFALAMLVPGDLAVTLAGGPDADPAAVAEIREQLDLDAPPVERYIRWLGGLARLDLGESIASGAPVSQEIGRRVWVTTGLALSSALVAVAVGVPLGVASGLRPGGGVDRVSRVASTAAVAIPSFCLAPVLVILLAVKWGWLPPSGYVAITASPLGWLRHITIPAITLGLALAASLARQLRASLIDVLGGNAVRTSWSMGARPALVMRRASRTAAIPALTVFGVQLGQLFGGTVVIEQIFSIPGLGTYMLKAVSTGDIPVVQGVTLIFVVAQLTMTFVVDLVQVFLDPRLRE